MTIGRLILSASLVVVLCAHFAMATVAWQSSRVLNAGLTDDAIDVAVDGNGKVYVGGTSDINNGGGFAQRFYLIVYGSALATPIFTNYYPTGNPSQQILTMTSLAVSLDNTVALSGSNLADADLLYSSRTTQFSYQGDFNWTAKFNATNRNKQAQDVAFDENSDAYVVVTETPDDNSNHGYVIKYSGSTGSQVWIHTMVAGNDKRYVPKFVVADGAGSVYVAYEDFTRQWPGGNWFNKVKVNKYAIGANNVIASSPELTLRFSVNELTDMIYVPCTIGGCSGAKVVVVTHDGLVALNASNLTESSRWTCTGGCTGFTKAAAHPAGQFAAIGNYGLAKFSSNNITSPLWVCTSVTNYVDVATTDEGGIVCIDTYNNDFRVTHFPAGATGCGGADTPVTQDDGTGVAVQAVAVATSTDNCASNIYVTGKRIGTNNDFLTMHFTISNSLAVTCPIDGGGSYVAGDADGNCIANISDAVYLIAYIFGGGPAPIPIQAGNVNEDGIITISDAVYLIAYIFSGGPAPHCGA